MSIDYGLGQTNIDKETGIRYGCFCAGRPPLTEWFWDSVEHDYGPPTCPECGNDNVCEGDDDDCEPYRKRSCGDYNCPSCKIYFGSDEAYPEEAIGWSIGSRTDLPYVVDCLDTDGLILKSLYYTYAPFCSPCVPGAGNLDDVDAEDFVWVQNDHEPDHLEARGGVRTYCLDKSWYQGEVCPYPYWSVETDELVYSPPEKTPVAKVVEWESGPIHPGCPICERDALADMPIVDPGPDWLDNIPVDLTGHLEGIDPNSVTDPYDEGDEPNDPTETYGDGEPDEPDVGGEAGHD